MTGTLVRKSLAGCTALASALLLSACGGSLPPPDWKLNAQAALDAHAKHYLEGDTRLADLNFDKARSAIAASGRPDILARAELARCAARIAALDFAPCAGYDSQAGDAAAPERAYADYLAGRWTGLDAQALPGHHAALLGAHDEPGRLEALARMKDPQARLVGAALLFKQALLPPAGMRLAVDTASERGWRRPLLAWLRVEEKRANAAGDAASLAAVRGRIALVLESKPAMSEPH
jgi:hypothetical protein